MRICRDGDLRLRARTSFDRAVPQAATVSTGTIPLRKPAPGRGAEDFYAHSGTIANERSLRSEGLELGVGVGTNFAVEVDLFVLRGDPFHG